MSSQAGREALERLGHEYDRARGCEWSSIWLRALGATLRYLPMISIALRVS